MNFKQRYWQMTTITLKEDTIPILKDSLKMKKTTLELNLARYKKRLANFEKKYQMTTSDFVNKFNSGEIGDDSDWFEWEFIYQAFKETNKKLKRITHKNY